MRFNNHFAICYERDKISEQNWKGYLATARTKPSLLLKGSTPRLIDELQVAPVIWDEVRHAVDERREKGQFILTGFTVSDDDEIMHT